MDVLIYAAFKVTPCGFYQAMFYTEYAPESTQN